MGENVLAQYMADLASRYVKPVIQKLAPSLVAKYANSTVMYLKVKRALFGEEGEAPFKELWYVQPGDRWMNKPEFTDSTGRKFIEATVPYDRDISLHLAIDVDLLTEANLSQLSLNASSTTNLPTRDFMPSEVRVFSFGYGNHEGSCVETVLRPSRDFPDLSVAFPGFLIPRLENLMPANKRINRRGIVEVDETGANIVSPDWAWLVSKKKSTSGTKMRAQRDYDIYYTMQYYSGNEQMADNGPLEPSTKTERLRFAGYIPKSALSGTFIATHDGMSARSASAKYDVAMYHARFEPSDQGLLFNAFYPSGANDGRNSAVDLDASNAAKNWNGVFGTLTTVKVAGETKNRGFKFTSQELANLATRRPEGLSILRKKYPYIPGVSRSKYITLSFASNNKPQNTFLHSYEVLQTQGGASLPQDSNNLKGARYYSSFPSESQIVVHVVRKVPSDLLYTLTGDTSNPAYYVSEVYLFVKPSLHNVARKLKSTLLSHRTVPNTFSSVASLVGGRLLQQQSNQTELVPFTARGTSEAQLCKDSALPRDVSSRVNAITAVELSKGDQQNYISELLERTNPHYGSYLVGGEQLQQTPCNCCPEGKQKLMSLPNSYHLSSDGQTMACCFGCNYGSTCSCGTQRTLCTTTDSAVSIAAKHFLNECSREVMAGSSKEFLRDYWLHQQQSCNISPSMLKAIAKKSKALATKAGKVGKAAVVKTVSTAKTAVQKAKDAKTTYDRYQAGDKVHLKFGGAEMGVKRSDASLEASRLKREDRMIQQDVKLAKQQERLTQRHDANQIRRQGNIDKITQTLNQRQLKHVPTSLPPPPSPATPLSSSAQLSDKPLPPPPSQSLGSTSTQGDEGNNSGIGSKPYILPSHEGRFTEWAHRHGFSSAHSAISAGLASSNPKIRREANFARNAAKWHHSHHSIGGKQQKQAPVESLDDLRFSDENSVAIEGKKTLPGLVTDETCCLVGVKISNLSSKLKSTAKKLQTYKDKLKEKFSRRKKGESKDVAVKSPTDMPIATIAPADVEVRMLSPNSGRIGGRDTTTSTLTKKELKRQKKQKETDKKIRRYEKKVTKTQKKLDGLKVAEQAVIGGKYICGVGETFAEPPPFKYYDKSSSSSSDEDGEEGEYHTVTSGLGNAGAGIDLRGSSINLGF